ncbi:Heat shock protein 9/12 [Metschnikowia aff. pulcherrima]|uniref:Heat shock protein 9/12 n=2 Tax=Metschnikowia TaxID=27320 RepID=A0A4P6XJ22_9ASCO|nr:Heat shock protein 9/12 [Metschnikowia aff. pulcherrima]
MEKYIKGQVVPCSVPQFSLYYNHTIINMSDTGRKSVGDKIESAVKPDSQKGTGELLKDKVTDNVDNAVGDNTRSGDKSFLQQASDAVFGEKK